MKKFILKTAKLTLALMIPAMIMVSCSDDNVDPSSSAMPDKSKIVPR